MDRTSKRRRIKFRSGIPIILLWSKRDQRRFIDAVEMLRRLIADLETLLQPVKRKRAAAGGAQASAILNTKRTGPAEGRVNHVT